VLNAPGFLVDGDVDLSVDWDAVRTQMRRFHGYPYTSVGITLTKIGFNGLVYALASALKRTSV
jgi:hypothetical protein